MPGAKTGPASGPTSGPTSAPGSAPASPSPRTPSISARETPPGRSRRGAPSSRETNGQFHADRAGAAIEHGVDPAFEVGQHMGGGRGADMAGQIGRGRRDRAAGRRNHAARQGVGRDAQGHAVESGPRQIADARAVAARGRTRVSGPGQKTSASFSARASKTPSRRAAATSATWAISGLKLGRPLAR